MTISIHKPEIKIICGPTASGKTGLALSLAGQKPSSLISADSRQIYRGLDIVTGKDIPSGFEKKISTLTFNHRPVIYYEKDNLRLWGLDLLEVDEVYNAADFSILSKQIIQAEIQSGRQVFVVGGTGFYLKALVHPETLASAVPDEELRAQLNNLSAEELAQKLWELTPQRFVSMNQSDASNPRRLVRAIEVAESTFSKPTTDGEVGESVSYTWIGLNPTLDELKDRITTRVQIRLKNGAVTEVRNLLESFPDQNLPVYTTLGVKPLVKFIQGEIDEATLITLWVTDELNYAKRQITWFKKQPEIVWYDLDKVSIPK